MVLRSQSHTSDCHTLPCSRNGRKRLCAPRQAMAKTFPSSGRSPKRHPSPCCPNRGTPGPLHLERRISSDPVPMLCTSVSGSPKTSTELPTSCYLVPRQGLLGGSGSDQGPGNRSCPSRSEQLQFFTFQAYLQQWQLGQWQLGQNTRSG